MLQSRNCSNPVLSLDISGFAVVLHARTRRCIGFESYERISDCSEHALSSTYKVSVSATIEIRPSELYKTSCHCTAVGHINQANLTRTAAWLGSSFPFSAMLFRITVLAAVLSTTSAAPLSTRSQCAATLSNAWVWLPSLHVSLALMMSRMMPRHS
jgi:hypothetical protein